MLGAVAAGSFGYAIWFTGRDQQVAYVHTGTRLWELALSGIAALVLPTLRLPQGVRVVLGRVGLGTIVSCRLLIDGAAQFPGPAAAWPVGGLILLLAAGTTGSPRGVDRVLCSRGPHAVAGVSYALYLWHRPIVIGYFSIMIDYFVVTGEHRVGVVGAAIILPVSYALAWVTHRVVEAQLRDAAPYLFD